jgi:hypothetical protein
VAYSGVLGGELNQRNSGQPRQRADYTRNSDWNMRINQCRPYGPRNIFRTRHRRCFSTPPTYRKRDISSNWALQTLHGHYRLPLLSRCSRVQHAQIAAWAHPAHRTRIGSLANTHACLHGASVVAHCHALRAVAPSAAAECNIHPHCQGYLQERSNAGL